MTTPLETVADARVDPVYYRNIIDHISDGLYLGSLDALSDPLLLRSYGITHILSLTSSELPLQPPQFVHKHFKVLDTRHQNLLSYLLDAILFLEDAFTGIIPPADPSVKPKVYVHCRMGISRSASVVVGYMMKQHNLSYYAALAEVRSKRSCVNPNRGFESQLQFLASAGWREDLIGEELLRGNLRNPWDPEERRRPKREKWEKEGPYVWGTVKFRGHNKAVLKDCLQDLVDLGIMKGKTRAQRKEREERKKQEENDKIKRSLTEIETQTVALVGMVEATAERVAESRRIAEEKAAEGMESSASSAPTEDVEMVGIAATSSASEDATTSEEEAAATIDDTPMSGT